MSGMQGVKCGRLAGLALAALAFAVLLVGCIQVGGNRPTMRELIMPEGADAPARSKPATTAAMTGNALPMTGAWQTAGSWKAIVARARTSSKGPGKAKAGKGKSFLLVEVEFKNTRMSESLLVRPRDFTLKNSKGKKVASVGTASGYNGRGMREIGPGFGGHTVFAYRIPKGSAGYAFTFSPKVAGKRAKMEWGVP